MSAAAPQNTFDHMIGSGAFQWSWWLNLEVTGETDDTGTVSDDWAAEITCEDGNGGRVTRTIGHKEVMAAARKVMAELPRYASQSLARECSHLVFDADSADFDAPLADELLQFMVLGEIVFG